MLFLSAFFIAALAEPLSCEKIQELNDTNPTHAVQREIASRRISTYFVDIRTSWIAEDDN